MPDQPHTPGQGQTPVETVLALQPMRPDDVPTVSMIERSVFGSPWSASAFRYEIERNRTSSYFVLRYLPWLSDSDTSLGATLRRVFGSQVQDRSLLGYGGFWLVIDEAHITNLALRPEWRGQGLGELLLQGLVERALDGGAHMITLEVRAGNHVAQKLYQKYGFVQVGLRRRYYTDNNEDALLMTAHHVDDSAYTARLAKLRHSLVERLMAHPPEPRGSEAYSPD